MEQRSSDVVQVRDETTAAGRLSIRSGDRLSGHVAPALAEYVSRRPVQSEENEWRLRKMILSQSSVEARVTSELTGYDDDRIFCERARRTGTFIQCFEKL